MSAGSGRAPDSMHELVAPLGWVELNDPVDVRDVDASGCQVRRQEHGTRSVAVLTELQAPKLVVNLGPFLLIDLSVEFADDMTFVCLTEQVLESFLVEVDRRAGSKEDDQSL